MLSKLCAHRVGRQERRRRRRRAPAGRGSTRAYSARFRRWNVRRPGFGRGSAAASSCASSDAASASSGRLGRALVRRRGGIMPARSLRIIFSATSARCSAFAGSKSSRTRSPFALSASWHSRQYLLDDGALVGRGGAVRGARRDGCAARRSGCAGLGARARSTSVATRHRQQRRRPRRIQTSVCQAYPLWSSESIRFSSACALTRCDGSALRLLRPPGAAESAARRTRSSCRTPACPGSAVERRRIAGDAVARARRCGGRDGGLDQLLAHPALVAAEIQHLGRVGDAGVRAAPDSRSRLQPLVEVALRLGVDLVAVVDVDALRRVLRRRASSRRRGRRSAGRRRGRPSGSRS